MHIGADSTYHCRWGSLQRPPSTPPNGYDVSSLARKGDRFLITAEQSQSVKTKALGS